MESMKNGKITYAALQRLLEKAWDEQNTARVAALSLAIDRASAEIIAGEQARHNRAV